MSRNEPLTGRGYLKDFLGNPLHLRVTAATLAQQPGPDVARVEVAPGGTWDGTTRGLGISSPDYFRLSGGDTR
jgi:hypothetical protein